MFLLGPKQIPPKTNTLPNTQGRLAGRQALLSLSELQHLISLCLLLLLSLAAVVAAAAVLIKFRNCANVEENIL